MAGITSAIENLISALIGILTSIVNSIIALLQAVVGIFATVALSGVELVKSLATFLLSNIVIIAVVAAAYFGYQLFVNRRGAPRVTAGKKRI